MERGEVLCSVTAQPTSPLFLLSPPIPSNPPERRNPLATVSGCKGILQKKRRLPTLPLLRSTIGVTGLNFSVRNGKRWNPGAIVT